MSDSPATVQADDNTRQPYDQVLVDVIAYVYHYQINSPRAWSCAKAALLDAIGCVLETLDESEEACEMIGPIVAGTIVPNGFRLPGTSYHLDPLKGAFDLGSLIRYLDHNDAFPGAEWGHPSDNLGAILAVADWLSRESLADGKQPLTIRTVLIALTKAYEIQGCFQISNAFNKVGLDHTMLVKVAATAVTSWLLGLSEKQAQDALSQAWMDGAPLRAFRQSPNTGPRKGWAAGDACMRAVHLSLLTKNGQPGAPTILTTPRWGFYNTFFKGKEFQLPRPFKSWVIENVFFKIHAVEGHGASGIEAAEQIGQVLRARHLDPDKDIAHIRVRTQQAAMIIINKQGPLHNSADRDHCMQYMIAVVLLKGSMIETRDYSNDSPWASDPRVEALRKKIDLEEDPQMTADYHNREKGCASNALKVRLTDGTELDEVLVEYPVGHPWRDDTNGLVRAKFEHSVKNSFGDGEQSREILKMASLEVDAFADIPVYEFMDRFAKGAGRAGHVDGFGPHRLMLRAFKLLGISGKK